MAVTLLAWPLSLAAMTPIAGLTDSWVYVLQRSVVHGPGFGSHLTYTYGPLGFLVNPIDLEGAPFVLSGVFTIAAVLLINAMVVSTVRRRFPWWAATIVAYVLALAIAREQTPATAYLLDVFGIWLALQILHAGNGARSRRLWVLGGMLSGFSLLVAPSVGAAVIGALALSAVGKAGGWRPALDLGLPVATVTLLVLWVASGNAFDQLVTSFRDQSQVSSGYSAAMSVEAAAGLTWVLGVVALVVVLSATGSATSGGELRARLATLAAVALVVWLLFEEGFVRHDFHDLIFFAIVPYLLVAVWTGPVVDRPRSDVRLLLRSAGSLTVGVVLLVVAMGTPFFSRSTFGHPLGSLGPTLQVLASPNRSAALRSAARGSVRRYYGLPASWLAAIGTRSVAVDPIEQSVGWAYPQLHEVAPPSVQEYAAYTTSLDRHNADFYRSAQGPAFVLHDSDGIDGRDAAFDAPDAQVAIRCNYRPIASAGSWTLLRRHPGLCSAPRPIGSVTTGFGHEIAVPPSPPGDAVLARFTVQVPLWWKLAGIALKPTACQFVTRDGHERARFIVATAGDAHVLGFPSEAGALAVPPVTTVRIDLGGLGTTSAGVAVRFFAVRVASAG